MSAVYSSHSSENMCRAYQLPVLDVATIAVVGGGEILLLRDKRNDSGHDHSCDSSCAAVAATIAMIVATVW
jgi:hypothetical protein